MPAASVQDEPVVGVGLETAVPALVGEADEVEAAGDPAGRGEGAAAGQDHLEFDDVAREEGRGRGERPVAGAHVLVRALRIVTEAVAAARRRLEANGRPRRPRHAHPGALHPVGARGAERPVQIRVRVERRRPVPGVEIQDQPRLGDDHVVRFRERDLGEVAASEEEEGGGRGGDPGGRCPRLAAAGGDPALPPPRARRSRSHRNDASRPSVGRSGIIDTPLRVGGSAS